MRETLSAMVRSSRALIAWIVLRSPGEADRIGVGLELQAQIRRLSGLRPATARPEVTIPGQTMSVEGLREAVPLALVAWGLTPTEINLALDALPPSLPVRIERHTGWWTRVVPAEK